MKNPTAYYATDRRCYDGAPSSDLKKERDNVNKLVAAMTKLDPDARCVYFPGEGKYMIFVGNTQLLPKMYECKQQALVEAIYILRSKESK